MLSKFSTLPGLSDDVVASVFSYLKISYDGTYRTELGATENLKLVNKRIYNLVCSTLLFYHNRKLLIPLPRMPVAKINDFFRKYQIYKLELNSAALGGPEAYKELLNAIASSKQVNTSLQKLDFKSIEFKFSADNILNKLLKNIPTIRAITFNLCMQLTDADVAQLKGLPDLITLQFIICTKLTVQAVKSIAENNTSLTHLVLNKCQGLGPDLATPLKDNKSITKLNLEGSRINDYTLSMISTFQKLNYLNISECKDVTAEGMHHLVGNGTPITHLYCVNATSVNDNAMFYISQIPTLQHLQLVNNTITGKAIDYLQQCTSLTSLSLSRLPEIKDSEISLLANNASLTSLSLTYLSITSGIGVALKTLPTLAHLELYGCPINNDIFEGLTACHKLKTLRYSYRHSMQPIEGIKKLLPNVIIKKY